MPVDLVAGGIVSADSPKRLHLASSLRDDRTPEPVRCRAETGERVEAMARFASPLSHARLHGVRSSKVTRFVGWLRHRSGAGYDEQRRKFDLP